MAKQERSERTQEKLIVSAAEQFALQGFVKATLGDVSQAAGVTKGALFFHFATKDDLAAAVQKRGRDILDAMIADMSGSGESSLRVAVDTVHGLNRLLRSDPFVLAGVRIARERTTTAGSERMDFYSLWLGRLGEVLEKARKNGELADGVADASAHAAITAIVCAVETLAWMGVSEGESDHWLESLLDLVLPAIASEDGLRGVGSTTSRITR
ncbi:ScbR family autoregulator-binding transcription factor [Streptomyces alkaliphilus]|uniref:ScbR family autoregulator-binding transcription factor n=1 Tax=Streptomyces alkaliphilus TaxID=1472722 RepID=UPI0015650A22|nr:ScbR family autoregulator-binding transcription factor [Streptomyces alkaliphilus]